MTPPASVARDTEPAAVLLGRFIELCGQIILSEQAGFGIQNVDSKLLLGGFSLFLESSDVKQFKS